MHDYMICIDESGSPYLAHALFGNKKGGQKKDHKWYARENVKGSWRYWYDPESYRSWKSGVKKRVDTIKEDVRKTADAYKNYKAASKNQNDAYKDYKRKHPGESGITYLYGIDKYGRAKKKTDAAKEQLRKSSDLGRAIVKTGEKVNDTITNILSKLSDPEETLSKTITDVQKELLYQGVKIERKIDPGPLSELASIPEFKKARKKTDQFLKKTFGRSYTKVKKSLKKSLRDIDKEFTWLIEMS